jgi:methylated-DNA-protein-cysteine methyltransferase-like protein
MSSEHYKRIYAAIKKVPRGKVASYGQIAAIAGIPRHARQVGYALHSLPEGSKLPWHRIVNSQGKISPRGLNGSDEWQRILLEEEGVEFGLAGRINLRKYRWDGPKQR